MKRSTSRRTAFWAALATSLATLACGKQGPRPERDATPSVSSVTKVARAAVPGGSARPQGQSPAGEPTPHPETPQQLLTEWTRALNEADLPALERLYADRVRFYGQSRSLLEVVEAKRKALAAAPAFRQSVLGEPRFEEKGGLYHVGFRKRSGPPDALNDVYASLVLRKSPRLVIEEETDAATQKRLGAPPPAAPVPADCPMAVWQLVDSTREAEKLQRQIEQNLRPYPEEMKLRPGGLGPIPHESDGSYEVAFGVHHPERFEAYAWFSVDAAGAITVSAYTLNLFNVKVSPSKEAMQHFTRLCPAK